MVYSAHELATWQLTLDGDLSCGVCNNGEVDGDLHKISFLGEQI